MKIEYCDRCKKPFKKLEVRTEITIHSRFNSLFNFTRIVCVDCKSGLKKWLSEKDSGWW